MKSKIVAHPDGTVTFVGQQATTLYRMAVILHGMKFELKTGMKLTRGPSCFTLVRREFGLKGGKEKLLEQFEALVEEAKSQIPVEKKD